MLGWPKRHKLAHAFMWEHSYKRLKLAQLLGQLGFFLTHTMRFEVFCNISPENIDSFQSTFPEILQFA